MAEARVGIFEGTRFADDLAKRRPTSVVEGWLKGNNSKSKPSDTKGYASKPKPPGPPAVTLDLPSFDTDDLTNIPKKIVDIGQEYLQRNPTAKGGPFHGGTILAAGILGVATKLAQVGAEIPGEVKEAAQLSQLYMKLPKGHPQRKQVIGRLGEVMLDVATLANLSTGPGAATGGTVAGGFSPKALRPTTLTSTGGFEPRTLRLLREAKQSGRVGSLQLGKKGTKPNDMATILTKAKADPAEVEVMLRGLDPNKRYTLDEFLGAVSAKVPDVDLEKRIMVTAPETVINNAVKQKDTFATGWQNEKARRALAKHFSATNPTKAKAFEQLAPQSGRRLSLRKRDQASVFRGLRKGASAVPDKAQTPAITGGAHYGPDTLPGYNLPPHVSRGGYSEVLYYPTAESTKQAAVDVLKQTHLPPRLRKLLADPENFDVLRPDLIELSTKGYEKLASGSVASDSPYMAIDDLAHEAWDVGHQLSQRLRQMTDAQPDLPWQLAVEAKLGHAFGTPAGTYPTTTRQGVTLWRRGENARFDIPNLGQVNVKHLSETQSDAIALAAKGEGKAPPQQDKLFGTAFRDFARDAAMDPTTEAITWSTGDSLVHRVNLATSGKKVYDKNFTKIARQEWGVEPKKLELEIEPGRVALDASTQPIKRVKGDPADEVLASLDELAVEGRLPKTQDEASIDDMIEMITSGAAEPKDALRIANISTSKDFDLLDKLASKYELDWIPDIGGGALIVSFEGRVPPQVIGDLYNKMELWYVPMTPKLRRKLTTERQRLTKRVLQDKAEAGFA